MSDSCENLDDFKKLSFGASLSFTNAEKLYFEAETLHKAGALSRAFFLHQISNEECAKVDILTSWAFASIDGQKVDFDRIKTVIISHARKNRTNAYHLEMSDEELDATRKEAIAIFKARQGDFHDKANSAKNSSLYVNLVGSDFIPPENTITGEMVDEIKISNEKFLSYAYQAVKLLKRFQEAPASYTASFKRLKTSLEKLKDGKSDITPRGLRDLLDVILEDELKAKRLP